MPQHVHVREVREPWRSVSSLVAWHDSRPRASLGEARGWLWLALVAATFFWMSNPLVFIPTFYLSLEQAVRWTLVVVVLGLPWLRLPRVPWPWLLFFGLTLASQAWTIQPDPTDLSNKIYLQMAMMAFFAAANCEPVIIAAGLATGGVAVVLLSLYALHLGVFRIEYSGTTGMVFGGIGTNENILAYTVVISVAATMAIGWPRRRMAQALWLAALAVQLYGLYRAGSGTGYSTLLCLAVAGACVLVWDLVRPGRRRVFLVVTAGGVAVLAAAMTFSAVVLGKELMNFSGRVPFWHATYESSMALAPVLGSGWGAVWEHPWNPAPPNHVAIDIYYRAGYPLPHGHNFFVEVLPELGLVGLVVVIVMVLYAAWAVRSSGVSAGSKDPVAGRLLLLVLVALLASGITEPMLTVPLGWWVLALVVGLPRQRVVTRPPRARAGGAAPSTA